MNYLLHRDVPNLTYQESQPHPAKANLYNLNFNEPNWGH